MTLGFDLEGRESIEFLLLLTIVIHMPNLIDVGQQFFELSYPQMDRETDRRPDKHAKVNTC